MIIFNSENDFKLKNVNSVQAWIEFTIELENKTLGEINYIFCDDEYLLKKNVKLLKHNTLTDIISLDYSLGDIIFGDIFISIERVRENATLFNHSFLEELHRVMVHGILHYCGYKDRLDEEKTLMRAKEDYYLSLRTF